MTRADWVWVTAGVVVGLLVGVAIETWRTG